MTREPRAPQAAHKIYGLKRLIPYEVLSIHLTSIRMPLP